MCVEQSGVAKKNSRGSLMPQLYSTHAKNSSRGRFPNRSSGKGQVKSPTLGKNLLQARKLQGVYSCVHPTLALFFVLLSIIKKPKKLLHDARARCHYTTRLLPFGWLRRSLCTKLLLLRNTILNEYKAQRRARKILTLADGQLHTCI